MMIACLVGPDGRCAGRCEVNEDGTSPQIADGNTEWTVVMLDRVPEWATEKVIDGSIVARSQEEIDEEKQLLAEAVILDIAKLPVNDIVRLTHEALWKLEKATGEIPESTTFEEYLQGLVGA